MVKKYVKKPIPVEVIQYTPENAENIIRWGDGKIKLNISPSGINMYIETLEGTMKPNLYDYVIKGVENEYWFVKKSIFEKTYREVTEEDGFLYEGKND